MEYRFGQCRLDTDRHELHVDGALVKTEPQVFDLLVLLVQSAGRLVSKDDLVEAVWGGRIVSDATIAARINAARHAVGDDGSRQEVIKTVPRRGFRFLPDVAVDAAAEPGHQTSDPEQSQKVRFCTSKDGTHIAFATTGAGYPLLRAGHWLTHLEHDWHSPIWRPFLDELSSSYAVTRYDQRGNGLSDWDAERMDLEVFTDDLATVADAAGLDRFALFAASQGAPIAINYCLRHPERVSHLILHGGFVRGRMLRSSPEEREQAEAMLTLVRQGWGRPGSSFINAFTALFIPDGTREQVQSMVELQRTTTSPENAVRLRRAIDNLDVSALLEKVSVPALITHARNDAVQPLDEGRALASGIPGAEFRLLESSNHVILPQEQAWPVLFQAIRDFVGRQG